MSNYTNYNSSWTHSYKGGYIHGAHYDGKEHIRASVAGVTIHVKSYRAAQLMITRITKMQGGAK